jgi:MinD-like ATPase involved in chromosome partitioning or flagellar assembly
VESLLTRKISGQARVISFINASEILGMTMVMVNIAAVLAEQGKQVTLVDASSGQRGHSAKSTAAAKQPGRVILEVDANGESAQETGFETLPSGIRVLHVEEAGDGKNGGAENSLDLIQKIGKTNDYLLVDLALKPARFTSSILTSSDLTIIMSDYRVNNILAAKNTVTLLGFLGITPEKMAAVLVDQEGKHPNLTTTNLKPYIEANLGITLAEVISFDAKTYQLFYLDSQPIVQTNPNQKLAQDIRQIARYIVTYNYASPEQKHFRREISTMEIKN